MTPRPPELYESDSEYGYSDDDGFVFSNDIGEDGEIIRNRSVQYVQPESPALKLQEAAYSGNMKEFHVILDEIGHDINKPLPSGYTALMLACQNHHVEFVKYLMFDMDADPNANSNDMTALILTCAGTMDIYSMPEEVSAEDEAKVIQICQWLLERRAMVDKASLKRETALMHAAANGYVSVIQFLLGNRATLEACDNEERTALFYAVNDNRFEATKILIEAGALTDVEDRYHSTPKMLAQEKGFDSIVELFPPDPIIECVPNSFHSYQTYKDLIPTVFPGKEAPPYSPDIFTMLHGMRANQVEYKFYESCIGLPEFLTITDKRLREIGIEFPYQRKRILHGLLKFHEKSWSKDSLHIPKVYGNIQQYFEVFSNCLKQLIIVQATIKFADHHDAFGDCQHDDGLQIQREKVKQELLNLYNNTLQICQYMEKVETTLSIPPPMFVGKNVIEDLLNGKTFQQLFYRKLKIIGGIGLGIIAVAVIKSRLR